MDNREERRKILKENLLESIDYSRESSDEWPARSTHGASRRRR